MSPFAEKLSNADMADLAAFYAAQPPRTRPARIDPHKVEDGRRTAVYYQCTSCHRPDLSGQQQAARLARQDLDYLRKLIRGFKEKTTSDLDGTMTMAEVPLAETDIDILAHFLASLGGS
jgi:cytochrome c553